MISKCKVCGGSVEWSAIDAEGLCRDCGARQAIEPADVYEQAGVLAAEGSESSLEQAMALYSSIRGWQDADAQYIRCRTRLGQLRWASESVRLKEYEDRHETKMTRLQKLRRIALVLVLACIALATAVTMTRFMRYSRAVDLYTAGEYERSAAAFQAMGDYRDARARVYMSAVELYHARQYDKSLPYFEWLDGYGDNGYYLRKCRERLAGAE